MALSNTSMFVIAGLICAATAVLIVSAPDEGMLDYIYVDTVVDDPSEYTGRDIQIHGLVVTDSLEQDGSSGDYHFTVEYKGRRLAVVFDGQLPDTFAEGGEVVATGRLRRRPGVSQQRDVGQVPLEVRRRARSRARGPQLEPHQGTPLPISERAKR